MAETSPASNVTTGALIAVRGHLDKDKKDKLTAFHQATKGTDQGSSTLFGDSKIYKPFDDADRDIVPPEEKLVSFKVWQQVNPVLAAIGALIKNNLQVDTANAKILCTVTVDGQVFLKDVPPNTLLLLENVLTDMLTNFSKMVTLPSDTTWKYDTQQGLYSAEPTTTLRSKQIMVFKVTVAATDKFPAQVANVADVVPIGQFTRRRSSGTVPLSAKEAVVERLTKLRNAVSMELARANAERASATDSSNLQGIDKMLAWATASLTPS